MAKIRPFRGWRYRSEEPGAVQQHLAPLFDAVYPGQMEALYARPHNAIHLSVPQSLPQAAAQLQQWKQEGILLQETQPALYAYYQTFTLYGQPARYTRKGFVAMIRLDETQVIPHEAVLPHAVQDRVALLELMKLNAAPTHGLYRDPTRSLEPVMDRYIAQSPFEHIDYQGVINRWAPITDPDDIRCFVELLASQPVYLADGHHRYESSLAWRRRLQEQGSLDEEAPAHYHLMYLSNLETEDLRILPTHRIWRPAFRPDLPAIRERLAQWFELEDVSRSRRPLYDLLRGQPNSFGMAALGRSWLLRLREHVAPEEDVALPTPAAVKNLSYTQLHYFVFDRSLGIPYAEQTGAAEIVYEKDYYRALSSVNKGEAALSFIAQEVAIGQMLDICASGARMPQKSTYFYPKVVCGIVFASIDDHEA